ncbi:ROK family protein [Paenibacillus sp. 2TAB23]|uniref:ROK family transcriptional regulator n=1 Tax=Paenibacillus sp. 2TAB23 TaxID=3233004 RepID=UPI003F9943B1
MSDRISSTKEMKKVILHNIREALLALGSATKVELSNRLGISFPTVSKFLSEMDKEGELLIVGLDHSSGGRRANRYAYNPEHMLGLAVFLEKTEMNYKLFNCLGEVKETGSSSAAIADDVQSLARSIEVILAKYPKVKSIAIGVPGSVNNGRIIHIPSYEHFHDFDLKGYLEARFSIPVVVENDMNAAVLGYNAHQADKGQMSFIYLYFGQNGPGAGIIVNGQVLRGSTFFSGEVSYVPQYEHMNFGEALNKEGDSRLSDSVKLVRLDAISRLVASFTAIINPHAIIFCKDEMNDSSIAEIALRSADYAPQEHLPKLAISDWKQDYLYGLQKLGLDLMLAGEKI